MNCVQRFDVLNAHILIVGAALAQLRPTDYTDQDPSLLARCDPVRRNFRRRRSSCFWASSAELLI